MHNFKVGDIAILQNCYHPELNGCECEIVGLPVSMPCNQDDEVRPRYRIKVPADITINVCMPHQLRPLPDGMLTCDWADCAWKPNAVTSDA